MLHLIAFMAADFFSSVSFSVCGALIAESIQSIIYCQFVCLFANPDKLTYSSQLCDLKDASDLSVPPVDTFNQAAVIMRLSPLHRHLLLPFMSFFGEPTPQTEIPAR